MPLITLTRHTVKGHSLGAAVATLDAAMLRMHLPSDVEVDSVVFGLPRVGNQQFANMIGSLVRSPIVHPCLIVR